MCYSFASMSFARIAFSVCMLVLSVFNSVFVLPEIVFVSVFVFVFVLVGMVVSERMLAYSGSSITWCWSAAGSFRSFDAQAELFTHVEVQACTPYRLG